MNRMSVTALTRTSQKKSVMTPSISSNPPILHPLPSDRPDDAWVDAILQFAEPLATDHVLVVAEHGLDLLCALIRQGCAAATCIRSTAKADAATHDLILIPDVATLSSLDHTVRVARRVLLPFGRVVIGVAGGPENGRVSLALARRLRLNGFRTIRSKMTSGLVLLRAELRSGGRQT